MKGQVISGLEYRFNRGLFEVVILRDSALMEPLEQKKTPARCKLDPGWRPDSIFDSLALEYQG